MSFKQVKSAFDTSNYKFDIFDNYEPLQKLQNRVKEDNVENRQ